MNVFATGFCTIFAGVKVAAPSRPGLNGNLARVVVPTSPKAVTNHDHETDIFDHIATLL